MKSVWDGIEDSLAIFLLEKDEGVSAKCMREILPANLVMLTINNGPFCKKLN